MKKVLVGEEACDGQLVEVVEQIVNLAARHNCEWEVIAAAHFLLLHAWVAGGSF